MMLAATIVLQGAATTAIAVASYVTIRASLTKEQR